MRTSVTRDYDGAGGFGLLRRGGIGGVRRVRLGAVRNRVRALVLRAAGGDHVGVLLGRALLLGARTDLHVVEREQRGGPWEDHVPEQTAGRGNQADRAGELAPETEREFAPDPGVHR